MRALLRNFSVLLSVSLLTLVCKAADDYQEVGYEDLVQQISSKKRALEAPKTPHPFDQVKIHTGLGYVNSFSQMNINNRDVQRYQNGMQLSLGVDLFSENWFADASFRNFGITTYGSEELILKELDLKFGFKDNLQKPLFYRFQAGLANRYLRVTDSIVGTNINDTTPMFTGSAGIAAQISPFVSIGLDFSAKSSLIDRTADKSAFDFTFDVKASL